MRHYGKSQLVECNPDFGGIRVPMQARLSLRENPDGTVSIVPHPIRREPNLDEYLNVKFTPEDQENLKKTGNLGRVAEVVDPGYGRAYPLLYQHRPPDQRDGGRSRLGDSHPR